MMIDADMNRSKLRLIIPLWACLVQICQPIVLALESRGVHLKKRNRRKQAGFVVECSVRVLYNFRNLFQVFKIKNGAKEPGLKAHYTRKMKNPVTILRQENVEEVLCDGFT